MRCNLLYNFSNTIKQETHITTDKNLQPIYTEIYDYTYDHANRLTAVNYRCGENAENKISLYTNSYDELGRLTQQQFYDNKAFASYQYDIHNNPTLIKNVNFTQDINYTGDPQNASGKLIPQSSGYLSWNSQRYYNGNVSATRTNSQNQTNFLYDKSNRLIESYTHTTPNKNSLLWNQTSNTNTYNERFAYDNNGNISKIARTNARGEQIDNFNIQYTGNQIRTITDYAGSKNAKQTKEYQDYATNSEFSYDANGNLTRDGDRNISTIRYNVLNLPEIITFANGNMIENYYSGDGIKYRSVISTRKTTTSIARVNGRYQRVSRVSYSTLSRYYIGNKEYTQTDKGAITLTRLHNAIGYVVPSSDNKAVSGWYHYAKDYLGNVREVYRVNPKDSKVQYLVRYNSVHGGYGQQNDIRQQHLATTFPFPQYELDEDPTPQLPSAE